MTFLGMLQGDPQESRMAPGLRIASYNIHGWVDAEGESNLDRVADIVNQHDPDILCLQEVYACWDMPCLLEFIRKVDMVILSKQRALITEHPFQTLFEHTLRWEGCAILSKKRFLLEEYSKEDAHHDGVSYHRLLDKAPGFEFNRPRYLTVRVKTENSTTPQFYLSCIHLGNIWP